MARPRPTHAGPALDRRSFLRGAGAALSWAALAGAGPLACARPRRPLRSAAYLVPGYRADHARYRGRPALEAPELRRGLPAGWEGPVTLVTRLDERDGSLRRALLPVEGHAITVAPGGGRAFWSSLNGDTLLSFDARSLALDVLAEPDGKDLMGGGHAVYTSDGGQVVVAERRRFGPYAGSPRAHHGRITIRDARSLRVLERHDCHGVSPHEVALLADGRHLAIANYGILDHPSAGGRYPTVEPSLTVLELASGRLVYKRVEPDPRYQVRHLAAHRRDRIAAILVHHAPPGDAWGTFDALDRVHAADLSVDPDLVYHPAPLRLYDASAPGRTPREVRPREPHLALQGQSIVYDPAHDRYLATFTSSHTVLAVSAGEGSVEHVTRTDAVGIRYPRGIALHPDGVHYAVTGSWSGLALFRRDDHTPVLERARHVVFFDHSHMAIG